MTQSIGYPTYRSLLDCFVALVQETMGDRQCTTSLRCFVNSANKSGIQSTPGELERIEETALWLAQAGQRTQTV